MSRRKHSKIDKLPPNIKDEVEEMIKSDFTYAEIAEYIQCETDTQISKAAICRYAKNLNESLTTLRMAQENFRCITEELNRYPDLDTGEGILKLLAHYILESINKMPEEQWRSIKPDELIKHATALIKAASYKKDIDLKNKDLSSAGFEQIKSMVFQTMARERPELYSEVAKFLEDKMSSK